MTMNGTPSGAPPMVEARDLAVTYRLRQGELDALTGATFSLARGETCAVIGPSGCGKSTLLYVLAGLLRPSSGEVFVDGEPVRPKRLKTAIILQDYGLFPWMTVERNAGLGLRLRGVTARREREVAESILVDLGLWEYRHHYPAQLSGGQRQRVAVARALALEPDLLLMDEPFSSLDALTRESLQETVLDIWRKTGLTVILVTHGIEEAVFMGRRVLVMSPRPGRIVHAIENSRAGSAEYRGDPAFHRLCTEVRSLLPSGRQGEEQNQDPGRAARARLEAAPTREGVDRL